MPDWRRELRELARDIGGQARRVARAVDSAVDRDPYHVVGYRSYAARWRALVHGRVLQDEGIVPVDAAHSRWQNLLSMARRLESDPMPYAKVTVHVGGSSHQVIADDEGFLREWVKLPTALAENEWHSVDIELAVPNGQPAVHATAHVLVPSSQAAFGVISDMDDTVLQSEVTTFLRAARLMLLENSRTRLPFPGVAAFYRALHEGRTGSPKNPVFYVSSSPWNLYDVIADFLDAQKIPTGPLLLRDWDLTSALAGHGGHKSAHIREILDAYPWMRFILIGDSGQEDPEIYARIVAEYGARIMAVYIRDVSRTADRSKAIGALAEQVATKGSMLILADDTLAAAKHAALRGWVEESAIASIEREMQSAGPAVR